MPSAHAKLGPSSSKRWLRCPGSIAACSTCPDHGGKDAVRGTGSHTIFEAGVKDGKSPDEFLHTVIHTKDGDVVVDEGMVAGVKDALAWVEDYKAAHPHCIVHSEQRVDIGLAFGLPTHEEDGLTLLWGTCDLFIVTWDELVVFDLKMGFHEVDVGWYDEGAGVLHPNEQLALYGIGFEHDYSAFSFERIRFVIFQPATGGARELVAPVKALHEWRSTVALPAVVATLNADAPRRPSDIACQWCSFAPQCPELHQHAMVVAQNEFSVVHTEEEAEKALERYDENKLAQVLAAEKLYKILFRAAKRQALKMARLGQEIPGHKLVEGKRNRVWTDEARAAETIKRLGYEPYEPPSVISPAQAEKLVGKENKKALSALIEKPKGELTLAPLSDKRHAVEPDFQVVEDDFEAEDAEVVE